MGTTNTATPPVKKSSVNWKHLIESLDGSKCILCLGPGAYVQPGQERIEKQLAKFLKSKEKELSIRVYDDGWFHYLPSANAIDAWQTVKDFYEQKNEWVEGVLKKVSQIPFHLILNFTPDYKLKEAFSDQGLPFHFSSYLRGRPYNNDEPTPKKDHPFIFNLLGELDKRNSLVMTYNDFYSYLESVFQGNSMSPILKEQILDADYFIFLGMPFDKWYAHLFMRMLSQHDTKRDSKKYAANSFIDQQILSECIEQYTMTFVTEEIKDFIDELHVQCKEEKILRLKEEMPNLEINFDELRMMVAENEFAKIFELLLSKLKEIGSAGKEWLNLVLGLKGQFSSFEEKITYGTLGDDARTTEENKLRKNIIDFLDKMQKAF